MWTQWSREDPLASRTSLVGRTLSRTGEIDGPLVTIADTDDAFPRFDVAVDAHGNGIVVWEQRDRIGSGLVAASFAPRTFEARGPIALVAATEHPALAVR